MFQLPAHPPSPGPGPARLGRAWALLAAGLGLVASAAQAQDAAPSNCPDTLTQELRPRLPKALALQVQELIGADCRPFPGDPKRRLAAIVYGPPDTYRAALAPDEQALPLSLVLAVLPAQGSKPLQLLRLRLEEDAAVQLNGRNFVWDPAVYRLGPDQLAAGLRFHNSARGASCPDQRWSDELVLLLPEGRSLRAVFAAAMQAQVSVDGPLCGETAQWQQLQRTLAVERRKHQGWADLLLIEREQLEAKTEEATPPPPTRRTQRYRYDGQRYQPDPQSPWIDRFETALALPWLQLPRLPAATDSPPAPESR